MLDDWLVTRVRAANRAYRRPTRTETTRAVAALKAVLAGHPPDLTDLPLQLTRGTDTLLADTHADGPGWGALALRETTTLLIEVPHPGSDRLTARLGLDLFHAIPTAALLVAGAHRDVVDVAHRTDTIFHAFAQTLATTEIQLHGFAAASAPDTDAIVSPGAGRVTELHHVLKKTLTRQGFRVHHHEHLAGRTNAQGIASAARGTPFLHLELAPLLRLHHRHAVVEAVANTWHQQGHHQKPDE